MGKKERTWVSDSSIGEQSKPIVDVTSQTLEALTLRNPVSEQVYLPLINTSSCRQQSYSLLGRVLISLSSVVQQVEAVRCMQM